MGIQQEVDRELALDRPEMVPERHLRHFPEAFHAMYRDALECFVVKYLVIFLRGRQMYGGGPISGSFLTSPVVQSIVLNTSVSMGVNSVYAAFRRSGFTEKKDHNQTSSEMRYVLKILDECGSLGVPKCLAGGMLMLDLHCCQGVPIFE